MKKHVILTGLRTNAEYHLGNYLGGILPMVELQRAHLGEYQVNMFAPDLHSFTTEIDHKTLYAQTMHNLKVFVAAGMPIDNPDFFMYRQSFIPAHSELTWILSCFTGFSELGRMQQFEEKIKQIEQRVLKQGISGDIPEGTESVMTEVSKQVEEVAKDKIRAGLFNYPVLMAADILLYSAKYVPVGDDQRQHLELTRDVAIRMNNLFGDIFTAPEPWAKQLEFAHRLEGVRIRSLRNPTAKMSKSVSDPSGTIQLSDTPEEASKKIMTAETDSLGTIRWDWVSQPGITNLLQIYQLLSGKSRQEVKDEWEGRNRYGDLKQAVAQAVSSFLQDFQTALGAVDDIELERKLNASERAMNVEANKKLLEVQRAVGLRA